MYPDGLLLLYLLNIQFALLPHPVIPPVILSEDKVCVYVYLWHLQSKFQFKTKTQTNFFHPNLGPFLQNVVLGSFQLLSKMKAFVGASECFCVFSFSCSSKNGIEKV